MLISIHHDDAQSPAENRAVGDWVSHRIFGQTDMFERFASTAIVDRGRLIAGIVWHNYQPGAGVIELSGASESRRWLSRPILRSIFEYPFRHLGCQMVVTRTAEGNAAALRVNEGLGFTFTCIPRLRGRNEAEIIGTLTDDAWFAHPVYTSGLKV